MVLGHERRAWTLVYLCLGTIEGGTAAVMVRSLFGGSAHGLTVDLVLGLVSAAPAWSNLASLAYARRVQGRRKVPFLRPLVVALALCVAALALVPRGGLGLVMFLLVYGTARVVWAGIDTVRSVIWSVNYPRHLRARITGRIIMNGSLAIAAVGLAIGWLLDHGGDWIRWALVAAACSGLAGARAFGRFRVRGEQRLLEAERERLAGGARFDLAGARALLALDPQPRQGASGRGPFESDYATQACGGANAAPAEWFKPILRSPGEYNLLDHRFANSRRGYLIDTPGKNAGSRMVKRVNR